VPNFPVDRLGRNVELDYRLRLTASLVGDLRFSLGDLLINRAPSIATRAHSTRMQGSLSVAEPTAPPLLLGSAIEFVQVPALLPRANHFVVSRFPSKVRWYHKSRSIVVNDQ